MPNRLRDERWADAAGRLFVPVTFMDFGGSRCQFREWACDFDGLLTFGEDVAARQIEGRVLRIGTCQGEQILLCHGIHNMADVPQ